MARIGDRKSIASESLILAPAAGFSAIMAGIILVEVMGMLAELFRNEELREKAAAADKLKEENEELREKNAGLKEKFDELENRLGRLEAENGSSPTIGGQT